MARERRRGGCRGDLSEMPEGRKKQKRPHLGRCLSGKRILPLNLAGEGKRAGLVDGTCFAYGSARLQEARQLFANRMPATAVTVGMSIFGRMAAA